MASGTLQEKVDWSIGIFKKCFYWLDIWNKTNQLCAFVSLKYLWAFFHSQLPQQKWLLGRWKPKTEYYYYILVMLSVGNKTEEVRKWACSDDR